MTYNFNEIIDRKNTNSIKHDFPSRYDAPDDAIPMWVADMDFCMPENIKDALKKVVEHGIFGYSDATDGYFEAVHSWFNSGFGYSPKEDWLVKTPGVVFAIAMAIKAYTKKGDRILIQKPVYHPFEHTIRINDRIVVDSPLIYDNNKYTINFDDFEAKIKSNNVRMFILCSPHNPVMRVWTRSELKHMGDICKKYGVIVLSDEIHCDFVIQGQHTVFTDVDPCFAEFSLVSTAPSKTFNISGLQVSNNFIPNIYLRHRLKDEIDKSGYHQLGIMGLAACQAAYTHGGDWHKQMLDHIRGNIEFVQNFLQTNMPHITLPPVEATYLLWLNFSALKLPQKEIDSIIKTKGKVWLHNGTTFGEQGVGFMRMNIGCPLPVVEQAMEGIKKAIG
ncbi:MAG: pyridoxal phosphate-dependent aminotransferase [Defluviitaleaceae bacterium]|nr:pyridoxal phosphate-dependent aminotransferase [Defluviitaleaceae bacterium]